MNERLTGLSKKVRAKGWAEVDVPVELVSKVEPGCRKFCKDVDDGVLQVMVSPSGPHPAHMSMSHVTSVLDAYGKTIPDRLPTWEELRDARYLFCLDELTMAMVLPPKAHYVNLHTTTFHLFEMRDIEASRERL